MIGFGELRRRASEWKQDISDVERLYATDWLLKGVFDQAELAAHVALRGASALRFAYAADYALDESPEMLVLDAPSSDAIAAALQEAAKLAQAGGVQFTLADFKPTVAQFDYVGPLGRRSAAQPHVRLALVPGGLARPAVRVPLIHRFPDECRATVAAVALEDLAAERIVALSNPAVRARDVYDLWFILTHLREQVNRMQVRALVDKWPKSRNATAQIAFELAPAARQSLERAWEVALRRIPDRPAFHEVERDLRKEFSASQ